MVFDRQSQCLFLKKISNGFDARINFNNPHNEPKLNVLSCLIWHCTRWGLLRAGASSKYGRKNIIEVAGTFRSCHPLVRHSIELQLPFRNTCAILEEVPDERISKSISCIKWCVFKLTFIITFIVIMTLPGSHATRGHRRSIWSLFREAIDTARHRAAGDFWTLVVAECNL